MTYSHPPLARPRRWGPLPECAADRPEVGPYLGTVDQTEGGPHLRAAVFMNRVYRPAAFALEAIRRVARST